MCVGFAVFVVVLWLLVLWLDPNLRRGRAFETELAAREPMSDNEMISHHSPGDKVAPDVPGQVRRVFAKYMGYPAEKLLPDDDLTFFFVEVDMVELVNELESGFGITITQADSERTPCTIRAVSMLVAELTSPAKE